jgi:hypothetical protein
VRVLIFVGNPADNQLGRAHSLWAIANESGHDVRIQSVVGGSVWAPLRDSHFAERCEVVSPAQLGATASNWADVMIVVKPRRESLGVALSACDTGVVPLLVDVDDPDLDSYLVCPSVARRLVRHVRHPREVRRFRKLRKAAVSLPTITSNPVCRPFTVAMSFLMRGLTTERERLTPRVATQASSRSSRSSARSDSSRGEPVRHCRTVSLERAMREPD